METWEGGEGVWLAWCGLYYMWAGHILPSVGGGVSFMLSLHSPYLQDASQRARAQEEIKRVCE